jgi:hypothetical protein
MEHYLVKRPTLTLHPAAARRVYLDVTVDRDVAPGVYDGSVTVKGPQGSTKWPLRLTVADVQVAPPPFAVVGEKRHGVLDRYGFSASIEEFKPADLPPLYRALGTVVFSHEWQQGRKNPNGTAAPEVVERHRQAKEPFWIADQLLHAKEQAARFTFGVWLWRTGATGRLTALGLGATGQRGRNAYHTLCGGNSGNVYRAVIDSLAPGEHNPSRDLLLMRQGIDDARLLYALDAALQKAPSNDAARQAKAFRDALWAEIDLDLKTYYRIRTGSYAEDAFVKPGNPWTSAKFSAVRKSCAEHLRALRSD